jgi:hypothetical protein
MHGEDATLLSVAQGQDRPDLQLAARADEGAKRVVAIRFGEEIEHLGRTPSAGAAEKAGGENAAAIHDHEITFAKETR